MRRLLACILVVAGVSSAAVAGAATTQILPEDEARAKAIVLEKPDFPVGFEQKRPGSSGRSAGVAAGRACRGLRLVDLQPTGAARSDFTRGLQIVQSYAYVYPATGDAAAAHRGFSGRRGRNCFSSAFRGGLGPTARLVSLKSLPFPRLAAGSAAFRAVHRVRVRDVRVLVYADFVMLRHSRAQAMVLAASGFVPLRDSDLRQLARTLARRMQTAMQGA